MRVIAVIPMWNQLELTLRCLRTLQLFRGALDELVIVDNGSWPDPAAALHTAWPEVTVIRFPQNRGFAAGANAGIRHALERRAEAVLLLNNDLMVDPQLVPELARVLAIDSRIAATGAKMLTDETPPRIHAAYGAVTFHGSLVRVVGWLEPRIDEFDQECDADTVFGGAVLLRSDALRDVGLFDEEFFAYHEDADWCTRARKRGWRIRYVPSARVYHRMHASTGGGYNSALSYLVARNSVLFVRKNATLLQLLKFMFYSAGNLAKDGVYRWRTGELIGYRLRLRGLYDGLMRRPVPLAELRLLTPVGPHAETAE